MKKRFFLSCVSFIIQVCVAQSQNILLLSSPNKNLNTRISIGNELKQIIQYDINYQKASLLKNAAIGLELAAPFQNEGWKLFKVSRTNFNENWTNNFGEQKTVTHTYNELILFFENKQQISEQLIIHARASNEGFAYRYEITSSGNDSVTLIKENSGYTFSPAARAWASEWAQSAYKEVSIHEIRKPVERPLTIKVKEPYYIALGEAGLFDFARMKLISDGANTLKSVLDGKVSFYKKLSSPWRYIMVGNSPADLLSKNNLVLNLNKPSVIKNTSWIKPGKVIREVTLTTKGSLATIDFAAKHNLQYILFDAGWYGQEDHDSSDAKKVSLDPLRSKGPLDLQKVIAYGKQKNVGVILYVNRRSLERQLDSLLPIYQKWGVKGIKFGFVNVGSQYWTQWLHEAVAKAAKYNMIVDIHDEYRPTGLSRTYPNLLTQEGIRGDEETPGNEQTLITLFTRMIAGAGDQTNCYFTDRPDKMGSHATQLAKSICIFSPLQFLFWYDRPALNKADTSTVTLNGYIREVSEMDFFKHLPTVWDDTKILEGSIGNYATIARKKDMEWFIGSINGALKRNVSISLSFLDKNKKYKAIIYSDDPTAPSITKVKVEERVVSSTDQLNFLVKSKNGLAIRLVPQ